MTLYLIYHSVAESKGKQCSDCFSGSFLVVVMKFWGGGNFELLKNK